jgi:hypothetical protein
MDAGRKSILIAGTVLGCLLTLSFVAMMTLPHWRYRAEIRIAEEVISQVERFKIEHGRYPLEQEFEMPDGATFYELYAGEHYRVGFSLGFDRLFWYDSRTRKWSFDEPTRAG